MHYQNLTPCYPCINRVCVWGVWGSIGTKTGIVVRYTVEVNLQLNINAFTEDVVCGLTESCRSVAIATTIKNTLPIDKQRRRFKLKFGGGQDYHLFHL